ncbi:MULTISPECIES: DUF6662 family protein [unclassified Duganella]|uniref:DUF6662 family protein n=1 Tax=unclassified Duganella TaxID=2636909 RepID=UPI0006F9918B|nr:MULTISPECIES: DUF6662 family protein [unclassified Duganella]KQV54007.1 hypothetical protein ASD07_05545 [Duganella sp. Root336D2]KRB98219.1 hypothetical protein ASE26_25220 [Duganella sp. Root198D2]
MRNHVFLAAGLLAAALPAVADENLFGYVRGSEVLPKGSGEFYQWVTQRNNKGTGHYRALDTKTEVEYGVTDRFQVSAEVNGLAVKSQGLLINGYLPKDIDSNLRLQGFEVAAKYNFLSPAKDDFGLSAYTSVEYGRLDVHSGQRKRELEFEAQLQAQKYFLEGQLTWVGNIGLRAAHEKRKAIADLPEDFEWPADPEMEISTKIGTGLSYRFAPGWYAGVEALFENEYETEVGQERWSVFGGPSLHYGGKQWWATLTVFRQLRGGGERYDGQPAKQLHLIERTKNELRLKVGYNF